MARASRRTLVWLGCALLAGGCAPKRPVLYPNPTLERAGRAQSERDIEACFGFAASQGFGPRPVERTVASSAGAAAVGAAAGAAAGAVRGDPGRRAGAWGAGAAAGGFVRGLLRWRDPDPIQARFVQRCLADQGYAVIGWR